MKKKLLAISFLVLMIAGCAPTSGQTMDVYGTSVAAQGQAQVSGMLLTGTAQAPIIHITETAAGLIVNQTQVAAQKTELASSWTPTSTMTPSITPTPTPNITATIDMANVYSIQTQTVLDTKRAEISNNFWAVIMPIFLLFILGGLLYFAISWSRMNRHKVHKSDVAGDKPLLIDIVRGEVIDMDASPNFSTRPKPLIEQIIEQYLMQKYGFVPEQPLITAERQDSVKERDQVLDLRSRAMKRLADSQRNALPISTHPQITVSDDDMDIPLPPWGDIVEWNGQSLPLGKGRHGLITAQAASPHILISGKTGSGKTIYMLRTLVTASLAMGEQVVNLGYSDSGFGIFETHANYHSLQLDKASDIIPCLRAVYSELQSRKNILGGSSMDWEHWQGGNPPRPFVRLVMDELGNMAEDIYMTDYEGKNTVRDLWRWVAMIANEGRKVGIRFVAALQDPTAKSMDLRFRRNCTLVAFQQGDASQSSAFMGMAGAEQLPVGRFMARMEQMTVGGGFAPTDEEIGAYLSRHAMPALEKPSWINLPTLTADEKPRIEMQAEELPFIIPSDKPTVKDEIAELAEKIRSMWSPTLRQADVARLLGFPQTGGSYGIKSKAVMAYLEKTTTTTTTTTAENGLEMPVLGLVGASSSTRRKS